MGVRDDPYFGFNFLVEIQGLIAGGFTSVSGLRISTEVVPVREGGLNTHEYKLPGGTSYSDLVLRRGVSDLDLLWGWYQDVIAGKVSRRNGTIYLLSHANIPVKWWDFVRAYPVAWEGPEFDASSNQVLFQALTIAHEGLFNGPGF
ncbi:phage tail protein [Sorangium sp. So ce726]|uniref:phage tail protein n=1 Tax=Sorangium sp. So ce726 TaxID=3133319 RepID=UPI003F5E962A